jgi:hypothetical protein
MLKLGIAIALCVAVVDASYSQEPPTSETVQPKQERIYGTLIYRDHSREIHPLYFSAKWNSETGRFRMMTEDGDIQREPKGPEAFDDGAGTYIA